MGAFSDLMIEAQTLGALEIHFSVQLEGYKGDADTPRWAARAELRPDTFHQIPHVAKGRTGEEALRELVGFLRAISSEREDIHGDSEPR